MKRLKSLTSVCQLKNSFEKKKNQDVQKIGNILTDLGILNSAAVNSFRGSSTEIQNPKSRYSKEIRFLWMLNCIRIAHLLLI